MNYRKGFKGQLGVRQKTFRVAILSNDLLGLKLINPRFSDKNTSLSS